MGRPEIYFGHIKPLFTHAFQTFFPHLSRERTKRPVLLSSYQHWSTSKQMKVVCAINRTDCAQGSYGNYAQVKMHIARVWYNYHYLLEVMLHFRVLYMIMCCMLQVRSQ